MLISCPKCFSVYEISDDLISKTGKKFRCCKCAHIWHAVREDAIGYEEEKAELLIEPITVQNAQARNFPANRKNFSIPTDTKSGQKTISSEELLKKQGDPSYSPKINPFIPPQELTLTSDSGTAFTISMENNNQTPEKNTPYFFDNELKANKKEHLTSADARHKNKSFSFISLFLLICLALIFLHREIVAFYPKAEHYYNIIKLSGQNNPEYLRFQNIKFIDNQPDNQESIILTLDIYNDSFYTTSIPTLTINNKETDALIDKKILSAYEKTFTKIVLPKKDINTQSLTFGFKKN